MISHPRDSMPHIQFEHVDGPMLHCRDGSVHFLTWRERIALKFGMITLEELDARHRSIMPAMSVVVNPEVTKQEMADAAVIADDVANLFTPGFFDDRMVVDVTAVIANRLAVIRMERK